MTWYLQIVNIGQGASLMAWTVKNLPEMQPSMQETQVRLLGWKDLLEKEMATYSSIYHGVNGGTVGQRNLVGYSPRGHKKVGHSRAINTFTFKYSPERA